MKSYTSLTLTAALALLLSGPATMFAQDAPRRGERMDRSERPERPERPRRGERPERPEMPPPPPHRPGGPHGPGGPGGAGGPGGEGLLERLLNNPRAVEFLELTDEQIAEMRAARDAMRDAVKPVQDQIREQSEALRELMTGDVPPTEEAARQLAEEIGLLRTAIQVERLATMVKMRNILTPEQVEKLRGLRERMERREGPPAWAGPRGDRGRGERGEGRPEWAGRNEDRGERGREGRGRGEGRPWRDRN